MGNVKRKLRECLRCGNRAEKIGCEVYEPDETFRGIICEKCASKPPKHRHNVTRGKLSGKKGKRRLRECSVCGKEFKPAGQQEYCSEKCWVVDNGVEK